MARSSLWLPGGARLSDFVSLGVLARSIPVEKLREVLARTGRESKRVRGLPAHVVMYLVIALALYRDVSTREVLRCLLEGVRWLGGVCSDIPVVTSGGIAQARARLGAEPMRMLYEELAVPVATKATVGASYRSWRLMTLDGSTLDVADTEANAAEFGYPGVSHGKAAFPQLRFCALVECGTHVLVGARMGPYRTSEVSFAKEIVPLLGSGMLCVADRGFMGYELFRWAKETGAELLWRAKNDTRLDVGERLPDGSFLGHLYPNSRLHPKKTDGIPVRVVVYTLQGSAEVYRLVTTILDHRAAPANELAALYAERWEIENSFDEIKTHLRGKGILLRSKTPELVKQEFYGLLLAHYALRALMHEAALQARRDPDKLSFLHAVRVVRRRLPELAALPPSEA
jgi:hypothetical protein